MFVLDWNSVAREGSGDVTKVHIPSRTEGPREMFSLGAAATFLGAMLDDFDVDCLGE